MALRVLEAVVPSQCADRILEELRSEKFPQVFDQWSFPISERRTCVKALLDAESTEGLTDAMTDLCGGPDDFRLVVQPVEAVIPAPEARDSSEMPDRQGRVPSIGRISREELHADIEAAARLTLPFLIMCALSALVAVIGLTRDSVAIVIGAMVIAPLLGPNIGLALAIALADATLALRSLRSLAAGFGLALTVAVAAGLLLHTTPGTSEMAARTAVGWGDILLAVAAGAAGGLTYTTGVPNALVGVMVAVALLPAWVTFGMLLGAGHPQPALGALLLTAINLICLNLAGVATFLVQGVRPARWWAARKARRMSLIAITAWSVLLIILIILSYVAHVGRT